MDRRSERGVQVAKNIFKKGIIQHQPSCSSVSIWFIVGLACVAGLALLTLLATIILLSRRSSSSRRRNPDPAVFLDQLPPGRRQEDKEPSGVEELSRRAQERSSWTKQQDFPRYPVSRHLYQVDERYIVVFLKWNHKTWSFSRPRKDKRGSDNKDLVEDRHWTTWTSDFTNCRASLALKYIPIMFDLFCFFGLSIFKMFSFAQHPDVWNGCHKLCLAPVQTFLRGGTLKQKHPRWEIVCLAKRGKFSILGEFGTNSFLLKAMFIELTRNISTSTYMWNVIELLVI